MRKGQRRPDYTHCTGCGSELTAANVVYVNYNYVDGVERRALNICNVCRNRRKIECINRRRMSVTKASGRRVPISDNVTAKDHPHFRRWLAETVAEVQRTSA